LVNLLSVLDNVEKNNYDKEVFGNLLTYLAFMQSNGNTFLMKDLMDHLIHDTYWRFVDNDKLRRLVLYLLQKYQTRVVHLSKKIDGNDISKRPFVFCIDEANLFA